MELKGKRVLVTGGSGFIGSHLIDRLFLEGAAVVSLCRGQTAANFWVLKDNPNVKHVNGAVRDRNKLAEALEGVEIVFHLAAFTNVRGGIERPILDFQDTAMGTVELLQAMADRNIKHLVFLSAGRVYGNPQYVPVDEQHPLNPLEPYGLSKYTSELWCRYYEKNFGIQPIIMRLFSTYGERQLPKKNSTTNVVSIFAARLLNNEDIFIYGNGSLLRDFIYINDLINIIVRSVARDLWGEVFNVASGRTVTMRRLAETMVDMIHPANAKIVYKEPIKGDVSLYPDISRLKEKANYKEFVPLETGLQNYINWLSKIQVLKGAVN